MEEWVRHPASTAELKIWSSKFYSWNKEPEGKHDWKPNSKARVKLSFLLHANSLITRECNLMSPLHSTILTLIHSCNKYLFNTYYVQGTLLLGIHQ